MRTKEHGVTEYTIGVIQYKASFPNHEKACTWCDFCRSENSGQRMRCLLTSEILYAPTKCIGMHCPMEFYKTGINGEYIADDDNNDLEEDLHD